MLLTIEKLLSHGADVNIVAENDVLPLNIAMKPEIVATDPPLYHQIQDILLRKGAKSTWRQQSSAGGVKKVSFSGGGGTVSFAGGHNNLSAGPINHECTNIGVKSNQQVIMERSTTTTTIFRSFRGGASEDLPRIIEVTEDDDKANNEEGKEEGDQQEEEEEEQGGMMFSTQSANAEWASDGAGQEDGEDSDNTDSSENSEEKAVVVEKADDGAQLFSTG
jgi:hypothetical protein